MTEVGTVLGDGGVAPYWALMWFNLGTVGAEGLSRKHLFFFDEDDWIMNILYLFWHFLVLG